VGLLPPVHVRQLLSGQRYEQTFLQAAVDRYLHWQVQQAQQQRLY
jgi:hypothetical protein